MSGHGGRTCRVGAACLHTRLVHNVPAPTTRGREAISLESGAVGLAWAKAALLSALIADKSEARLQSWGAFDGSRRLGAFAG